MEKLDLQIFRDLKQEVVEFFKKDSQARERGEQLSDEEKEQFEIRYKEIIQILSNHDLSDIDFKEWEGMLLVNDEISNILIDFSKTKANIDFSLINYQAYGFPNFKSCQIKNFDFQEYDYTPEMFDEEFIKQNEGRFLSEELSERVRDDYYKHSLRIKDFSENLPYFEGKTVAQAFLENSDGRKIIDLYGEGIYQLFSKYKFIMDEIINDHVVLGTMEVPSGTITDQQRKEIMSSALSTYFSRNGYEKIQNWEQFKLVLDFISLENLPLNSKITYFFEQYGIDTLIESGLDIKYLITNKRLTNLEEISNLKGLDIEDIKKLLYRDNIWILDEYEVKQLLEYGIKDLSELSEGTNDLYKIKEMLEKRPIGLIRMSGYDDDKIEFIKKYGIDYIIALDEETGGIFSHPMGSYDDIYLTILARADRYVSELDKEKELSYDEFRDRIYELLLYSRNQDWLLQSGDYPDYDFIQGKFREEHSEIFIDEDIPKELKRKFYFGNMSAEDIRQNPELIHVLKEKDLSGVFYKEISYESNKYSQDSGKYDFDRDIREKANIAEYFSEKIGQEEFLKICAIYGKCLDKISLSIGNETTIEDFSKKIESEIYKAIKQKGIEYFEDLPLSFQEKHPELFLPKEIDEELREKFYKGDLDFEDIRRNPQIKSLLLKKDISVGFGNTKYGHRIFSTNRKRYVENKMWNLLPEKEIMNLAEKYGKFMQPSYLFHFKDEQSLEEIEKEIQRVIEINILNRELPYEETIPEFFKQRHPEMFLDEDAPEELKQAFYDDEESLMNRYFVDIDEDTSKISFELIKKHLEWKKFLEGKDLSRAFSKIYSQLFEKFDGSTLIRLGTRSPETIKNIVRNHREDLLETWYKSTGGKFVPHHVVMLNFPESEIDSFLANGKRWSQLMRIDGYNLNDDGKTAILKAAYAMGVFQGDDDGFNKTMKLFTDIPQELSQEEYNLVINYINEYLDTDENMNEKGVLFENTYVLNNERKYVCSIDKQKNKDSVRVIRGVLEKAGIPKIFTPEKAHQIFDSFSMEYNAEFVKFFNENIEEILYNPKYAKDIAIIQRQFKEIQKSMSGRKISLDLAQAYISAIAYENIDIGNEKLAEYAKNENYPQEDFEEIQILYNEGEKREFSSIPRVQGEMKGYTYEMLRLDDPLALTIGKHTNCCQEIHGAGETSMEHSVVSPDGRVFVVRNEEGKVVAQSWFWRNQYVGCFDNIEIPDLIFKEYEKKHPDVGRKGLTSDVLEVYKKAAQDLMQEDERVYQELLENRTITQKQYDALLLGRITIGAGYNDIKKSLREAHSRGEFRLDASNEVLPKKTDRFNYIYDDSHYEDDGEHDGQYIITEREGIIKSEYENLYAHQDDIQVFDRTNMSNTVLLTMKRMEQESKRNNLAYLGEVGHDQNIPKSQRIINDIATEYGLDPSDTKVMATARMAIIYSKDKENKVKIVDLLSSPIKDNLTEEQKQIDTEHIMYQLRKALKQIGIKDSEVELSSLSEEQKHILQSVMQEIKIEDDERDER